MPLDNQMLQDFMALSPEEQAKVTGNPGAPSMLKDFAALPHEERLKVLTPSTPARPSVTLESVKKKLDPFGLLDPATATQVGLPIAASMRFGIPGSIAGMAGGYVLGQLMRGEPVHAGTTALEGLIGAIPFGSQAKTLAGTLLKRAFQGGTLGTVATAVRKYIETGEFPSLEELAPSAATGTLVGLAGGGVERYLGRKVAPKVTPPTTESTRTPLALPPAGGGSPSSYGPTGTFVAGPRTILERTPSPESAITAPTSSLLTPRTPEELAALEKARLITTGIPLTDEQIIRARARQIDTGIKPRGFGDLNEPAFSTPGVVPSTEKVDRFQPKPQGTYVNITPEGTSSELGPLVPPTTKPAKPPSTFARTETGVSETTGVPPSRVFPGRQEVTPSEVPPDTVEFGLGIKIPDKWKGKFKEGVKAYLSSGQIESLAKDTEGVHATPPSTPTNPTPVSAFDVAQDKLVEGLRQARSARTETTGLQSVERSKRLGAAMRVGEEIPGREGFYAQKGALKGVLPKADFAPVELDEKAIGDLFTGIRSSKKLEGFDKITAQEGLENLFGIGGGKIPTDSQINLLRRVLKPEVLDQLVKERTTLQKALDHTAEALGFSKAMMAMGDMSAFRQAFPLLTTFPKQFRKAWVDQHKYFVNDDTYQAAMQAIEKRDNFPLYERMNLALTGIGGGRLGHEERFFAQLPTKIPIIRTVYKSSERAYEGMLTQLRADAADEMLKRVQQSGQKLTPQNLESIGSYINNFSGRGSLGPMSAAAGTLTTLLFSPRLLAARFNTLLNPVWYAGLEPVVRKQALKSALGTFTLGTTVLGLAGAAGLDVGTDPRSADFGKIKVGNTRISVFGGYEQYPRLLANLFTGEIVSSTSGQTIKLGENAVSPTRKSVAARFLENKEAPVPSFISRWLEGKNIAGEPFQPTPEFFKMFTQMVVGDIVDIYNDDPTLLPLAGLGWYGINLQTYGPKATGAGVVSPPQ